MSAVETQHIPSLESADQEADRYQAVRQCAWMGIIVHSSAQVIGIIFVLTVVLGQGPGG